jgi:hypothetical protein
VIWIGGNAINLNSLLPAGSGWDLQDANAVNNNNQIAGTGLYNGQPSAYFLALGNIDHQSHPLPEPGSAVWGIIGLATLARRRRADAKSDAHIMESKRRST